MIITNPELFKQEIEISKPQTYKNMTILPLISPKEYDDIITLKKGLKLELVEVKECEQSQVNTLIVKNNSTSILALIDGEQVIGGDQNRIVNETILVDSKSEIKIPVSCTEKGRWAYKKEFENSDYIANYSTRRSKRMASLKSKPIQSEVWNSIDTLEMNHSFKSETSAMEESYENLRKGHNEIINEFKLVDGQTGVIIIVDGKVKGFELFLNSEIYEDFHEKILKSYIIDTKLKESDCTIDIDGVKDLIEDVSKSKFIQKNKVGVEDPYEFKNETGFGSLYLFKNKLIHWSYFAK